MPTTVTTGKNLSAAHLNGSTHADGDGLAQTSVTETPAAEAPVAETPVIEAAAAASSQVSAAEIDRRRARQLLDRSFLLCDQGEVGEALLTCRQAINLVPRAPQGYSLLGLILERQGDIPNAIKAYETVIHLAPDNALERDSLQRLRARQSGSRKTTGKTGGLVFDDAGLFKELPAVPAAAASAASSPKVAMSTPAGPVAATGIGGRPSSPAAANVAASPSQPADADVIFFDASQYSAPSGSLAGWQRLLARPSYFYQGMPLLIVSLLSLFFLGWAQYRAGIQYQRAAGNPETQVSALPADLTASSANVVGDHVGTREIPSGPQGENPGQPFTIGNEPESASSLNSAETNATTDNRAVGNSSQSATAGSTQSRAPRISSSPSGRAPSGGAAPGTAPRALRQDRSIPPFPVDPMPRMRAGTSNSGAGEATNGPASANRTTGSGNGGNAVFRMPPPAIPSPQLRPSTSEPVATLPIDDGAPATFPRIAGQGNIRISPERATPGTGRVGSVPVRPAPRERETRSENGSGTAYYWQQRGASQLDAGQYERAIDSFNSAISAYQEQIKRGENVNEARAAIQACRTGIRMAKTYMG